MLKRLEIFIKGRCLRLSSVVLREGRALNLPLDINAVRRLLIIRPQKIGDFLVILPLVDCLQRANPGIEIMALASRECQPLIQNDGRFAKVYYFGKNPIKLAIILSQIRGKRPDLVWDMVGRDSVTSLWISQIVSGQAIRLGMGKDTLAKYYDLNFDHRRTDSSHIIANILESLRFWGIGYEESDYYSAPFIPESSIKTANNYFGQIKDKCPPGYFIGLNISAGGRSRLWPEEAYQRLVDLLLKETAVSAIILFCHPQDRKKVEKIGGAAREKVYLIPENLNLLTVSAIIKFMNLFISPDTSLVHIARGFKIPVVAFYNRYMDNYRQWYPVGQFEGAIISDSDDNISSITPEQAAEKVLRLLSSTGPGG